MKNKEKKKYEVIRPITERNQLEKVERKSLKAFEFDLFQTLPAKLKSKWKKSTLKEKLFTLYFFDSATQTEAAQRAGYSIPAQAAAQVKVHMLAIIQWVECYFLQSLSTRIASRNIMTREVIVEKLAIMFKANLADFENIDEAKRRGLMGAVQEIEWGYRLDPKTNKDIKYVKKIKLWDPLKAAALLCKMLGYEAPTKQEVSLSGQIDTPTFNIQINVINNKDEQI